MMNAQRYDVVIIGGGIIGLATAMALKTGSNTALAVLEARTAWPSTRPDITVG